MPINPIFENIANSVLTVPKPKFELTEEQRELWAEIDRKEAIERMEEESKLAPPQIDPFTNFEKEWLDSEIRDGVTNRDFVESLMMLMSGRRVERRGDDAE